MIKDSGDRREFTSGAVRDMAEGKGRCDLLPLDILAEHYTRIGLHETAHRVEADNRTPRPETLKKIARALNIPIEKLLVIGYDW